MSDKVPTNKIHGEFLRIKYLECNVGAIADPPFKKYRVAKTHRIP